MRNASSASITITRLQSLTCMSSNTQASTTTLDSAWSTQCKGPCLDARPQKIKTVCWQRKLANWVAIQDRAILQMEEDHYLPKTKGLGLELMTSIRLRLQHNISQIALQSMTSAQKCNPPVHPFQTKSDGRLRPQKRICLDPASTKRLTSQTGNESSLV